MAEVPPEWFPAHLGWQLWQVTVPQPGKKKLSLDQDTRDLMSLKCMNTRKQTVHSFSVFFSRVVLST